MDGRDRRYAGRVRAALLAEWSASAHAGAPRAQVDADDAPKTASPTLAAAGKRLSRHALDGRTHTMALTAVTACSRPSTPAGDAASPRGVPRMQGSTARRPIRFPCVRPRDDPFWLADQGFTTDGPPRHATPGRSGTSMWKTVRGGSRIGLGVNGLDRPGRLTTRSSSRRPKEHAAVPASESGGRGRAQAEEGVTLATRHGKMPFASWPDRFAATLLQLDTRPAATPHASVAAGSGRRTGGDPAARPGDRWHFGAEPGTGARLDRGGRRDTER